jgi:RNA polymerase I-specific transcription initiation factor RRN3
LEDLPEESDDLQFEVELDNSAPVNTEETAKKLDSMMMVMFEYLDAAFGLCDGEEHKHTFPPMSLNKTHREQLFNILLQIFDKYILTTYKSKYTQFLLFYVCRYVDTCL